MEEDHLKLKERNRQLLQEDIKEKRSILRGYPYFVALQTDPLCSLNCIMCFRQKQDWALQDMHTIDEKLFRKFADQVFPTAEVLQLNTAGEPLMSRNIDLELEYAAKYNVKLDLTTNGLFLNSYYRNIEILLRQLQNVAFSFDSPFKETYESIRIGADYDQVVNNMRFFQAHRNTLPPDKKPSFAIHMVLMKRNLNEVLSMIEFAKRICADQLNISYIFPFTQDMQKESVHDIKEEVNSMLIKAVAKAHEVGLSLATPPLNIIDKKGNNEKINRPCFFLWDRVYLNMDANIIACCSDNYPIMGSMEKNSFVDIWNGEKYQKMRQSFTGGKPYSPCYECSKTGYLSKLTL